MKLSAQSVEKLEKFFARLQSETYPESPSNIHTAITEQMIGFFFQHYSLPASAKVLDVGCGQGVALERFQARGFRPVGITLNETDVRVCQEKGFEVYQMDQSFLDFDDKQFEFIWCRHCLEHSVFPYFTLSELSRVLKPGGYLYVEVPAPDTVCRHQSNGNHYSVLGKTMWLELFQRSGFRNLNVLDLTFEVVAGPDLYWAFIQQKS